MQRVVVMRHGWRLDSEDPEWHQRAACPWDTPLSDRGVEEVRCICDPGGGRLRSR